MPTVAVIGLLALATTIISSVTIAVWVLSTKLNTVKSDLLAEIATLKTDIAVLKKSEESRDEKINRMWEWWMSSLEHGWMGYMTSQEKRAVKEI